VAWIYGRRSRILVELTILSWFYITAAVYRVHAAYICVHVKVHHECKGKSFTTYGKPNVYTTGVGYSLRNLCVDWRNFLGRAEGVDAIYDRGVDIRSCFNAFSGIFSRNIRVKHRKAICRR